MTICPSCYNRSCPKDDRDATACVEYVSYANATQVERQIRRMNSGAYDVNRRTGGSHTGTGTSQPAPYITVQVRTMQAQET